MAGNLFVLTAPSGAGKTTITRELQRCGDGVVSVSYTTRARRAGEVDGESYFFVNDAEFAAMRDAGEFLEYAKVHGCFYATPKSWALERIARGQDVILEIDVCGARAVRSRYPRAVLIFIMPPSAQALGDRLRARGADSDAEIARRLRAAEDEIAQKHWFDYVIINDCLETAIGEVRAIIHNHHHQEKKHYGENHC